MISIKPGGSINWPIKLSLCIGIGVPGIAIIAYLLQKHKNNENGLFFNFNIIIKIFLKYYLYFKKEIEEQYDSIIKTRQKIIELKIPQNTVSFIIGPQGKNIKEVIKTLYKSSKFYK
jgi:hypothetical protein